MSALTDLEKTVSKSEQELLGLQTKKAQAVAFEEQEARALFSNTPMPERKGLPSVQAIDRAIGLMGEKLQGEKAKVEAERQRLYVETLKAEQAQQAKDAPLLKQRFVELMESLTECIEKSATNDNRAKEIMRALDKAGVATGTLSLVALSAIHHEISIKAMGQKRYFAELRNL